MCAAFWLHDRRHLASHSQWPATAHLKQRGPLPSHVPCCIRAEVVGCILAGLLAVPLYGGHAMWMDKAMPWGAPSYISCHTKTAVPDYIAL
jgi:hypothetical protein